MNDPARLAPTSLAKQMFAVLFPQVMNMIKVFNKPIRVNKSSQNKQTLDVGALPVVWMLISQALSHHFVHRRVQVPTCSSAVFTRTSTKSYCTTRFQRLAVLSSRRRLGVGLGGCAWAVLR
jgi:hypothetical protein